MSNTEIWDKLGKTDPSATKQFSRVGGFKGTAIKPQWAIKRLTEYFGPVGLGWGIGEPQFQVVVSGEEILVYCTVQCWHTKPEFTVFGVGGDKVCASRSSGKFNDDEAFKKAFTDAVMNAFKFVGVGADIHLGQFDDSKYVAEMREEFSDNPPQPKQPAPREKLDGPHDGKMKLKRAADGFYRDLLGCGDQDMLTALLTDPSTQELKAQLLRDWPGYLTGEGMTDDWEPINRLVTRLKRELPTPDQVKDAA